MRTVCPPPTEGTSLASSLVSLCPPRILSAGWVQQHHFNHPGLAGELFRSGITHKCINLVLRVLALHGDPSALLC